MGEHAAVYGQPALVAAVNPRARVEARRVDEGLAINLADFGTRFQTSWRQVAERADDCRRAWQRYAADPTPERFEQVGSGSPEDLVLLTLGELASVTDTARLLPVSLHVESSLPIGSGFGSSASIAVAILGAVLSLVEGELDESRVDGLALEVERRQHGLPSGVDHKTVLYGGVILAERQTNGDLTTTRIGQRPRWLEKLQVYQTGQPAETTGEVVAAVRRLRDEQPEKVEALFERMGRAVLGLQQQLASADDSAPGIGDLMGDYQDCLEVLGVVPAAVRETIRDVVARGGGAKISGAGSLTGSSAGCLLVHWPEGPPAVLPARLREYQRQDVELGVDGLRLEEDP